MKKINLIVCLIITVLIIQTIPLKTQADLIGNTSGATLSLTPQTGIYNVNDNFAVAIHVNTHGQNVVAVASYLNYDKTNYQAVSVDLTGSIFTIAFENVIDATNGKIKITQAIPTPGVNTDHGLLATITFKALSPTNPATDNFTFDFTAGSTLESNVLLNDGLGTDVLSGVYNGKYTAIVHDTTAPVISNIVSNPAVNTAAITWTTNEAATSQINYGLTTNYGATTTLDSNLVTPHTVNISGLSAHTIYHYRIRTKDAAGNERVSGDYSFTTLNTAPVMSAVTITPNPAYKTTASLTVNPSATDADGDAVTYTYQWKKNAVNISGQTGTTLANTNFVKNDIITVTVVPNDGRTSGVSMTSAGLTISNSAPTMPTASLNDPAYDSTNLTCAGSGSADADGDAIIYSYAWYKNSVLQAGQTANTLSNTLTAVGEVWKCAVTASDGSANSAAGENSVTILTNLDTTAPVISGVASTTLAVSGAITWTTNEAATSQINYGLTTSYSATTTIDLNLVTAHTVNISGLTANTLYHYRIRTKDAAGNERISGDYTFKTKATADLNYDGRVNSTDASILMSFWGSALRPISDINQNGYVNSQDAAIMMSQWTN